jgi:hypothetical protein
VAVPAGYLVLAIVYNVHVVAGLGSRIQPGADGILFAWYLAWTKYCVLHWHNPFFSHAMNAPVGFNVTWNTWVPLLGLVCLPLVAAVGPFTTVAILLLISPAVSGASLYWVLRRVFGRVGGPALAGLLYGFGPWAIGQKDQRSWRHSGLRYILVAMHAQPRPAAVIAAAVAVTGCQPVLSGDVTVCASPTT